MISDPDQAGYRYPQPGERLRHAIHCTVLDVLGPPLYGAVPDEVAVTDARGAKLVVKLRNVDLVERCGLLREHNPHPWQLLVDDHQAVPRDAIDRWCDGAAKHAPEAGR